MNNGLHILYSPVNQAWFVMWFDTVLRILNCKEDALYEIEVLTRKVS